jgi:hypothetical protein
MLSIICSQYHNDLELPRRREDLYARAVEGLLGRWDAFRDLARQTVLAALSIRERQLLTSQIAYHLFSHGRRVFSVLDVEWISKLEEFADAREWRLPGTDELVGSLAGDFGILLPVAPGLYSFTHLTLQEFLVADFVVSQRKEMEVAAKFRRSGTWLEVFRLMVGILPSGEEFMRFLTNHAAMHNRDDILLLAACWEQNPVCNSPVRIALLGDLASKLNITLGAYDSMISDSHGWLKIVLRGNSNDTILRNIRIAVSLLISKGFQGDDPVVPIVADIMQRVRAQPEVQNWRVHVV